MEKQIDVGTTDEFPEGQPHAVRAADRDLVIVRIGDEFFAVRDACPHQGSKLSTGLLMGNVETCVRGDQPCYERDGEFLSCPWHGWKIDVRSGKSAVEPDTVRVRSYPVSVKAGRVYVEMGN